MANIKFDEYKGEWRFSILKIYLSITYISQLFHNPFSFATFISSKTSPIFLLISLNETFCEDKNFLTFAYCFSRLQNVMLTELPSDVLALTSLASSWNTSFNANKIFFLLMVTFSRSSLPSRATGRAILIHEIYDRFFFSFLFLRVFEFYDSHNQT